MRPPTLTWTVSFSFHVYLIFHLGRRLSFAKSEASETCVHTDQVDVLFRIFIFGVVLQRDVCGAQARRRALPVAVTVLLGPQLAQRGGSRAVHTG